MNPVRTHPTAATLLGLTLLALAPLPGCHIFSAGSAGTPRLESADSPATLELSGTTTAVYSNTDKNSADIYITNLLPADLLPDAPLKGVWGQFLHIRHFIKPKAGDTPIDRQANSVIIRQIVISDGQIGLYGGGGFMFDGGTPGDPTFGGSISDATMKPIAHSAGFVDRLGLCTFSGSVSAKLDAAEADRLRKGLNVLLTKIPRDRSSDAEIKPAK